MPAVLLALLLAAWPAPTQKTIEGCSAAACTRNGAIEVCKCVPVDGEHRPGLVIEGPASRHLEWDARSFLGDVSDFVVQTVQLDDGPPELIVASRAAESNGMMVRDWEVAIVDGASDGVMHLLAQDWGPDWVSADKTLLCTEWAQDGSHVAFTGREYRYESGRLEATDEPVRRRVFDSKFETERRAAIDKSPDRALKPRSFLSRHTKSGVDHPAEGLHDALVKGVSRDEPWLELHLQATADLETISGSLESKAPLRLGDWKKKRLLPLGYAPEDAETWLLGRRVQVSGRQVWLYE